MTTITESQWVNYFGFQRFPFDRPEAGNEEFSRPDFLASCFVEPKSFERVFGRADEPATSVLFAARGTGKTACRVMMDYYCKNGLARLNDPKPGEQYYILSVPHINLDQVREIARQSASNKEEPQILVEHHAIEIMRQAVPVFVDMIARVPEFEAKLLAFSPEELQELRAYISQYSAYLSLTQARYLVGIGIGPLEAQVHGTGGAGQDMWGSFLLQQVSQTSPLLHIQKWSNLVHKTGILATYVLVDGVDEIMETAEDPHYAYTLIRPLLAHLRLMVGTQYLALKFFLPSDEQKFFLTDQAFRKDKGFVIRNIEWDEEDLIKILQERLNALRGTEFQYRDRTTAGFDSLCVPGMQGRIESDLARAAKGNPRSLMNLCAQMVHAHCTREIEDQDDPYQLNRTDFDSAIRLLDDQLHVRSTEPPSHPKEQDPATFEVGQIIDDKYKVEQILPKGGAGQVYCVFDPIFERQCALKIYENTDFLVDSFKNEVRLLRNIEHPHIVQVYGWGQLKQSGRYYLTSEYIDGPNLKFYTDPANLLPIDRAVQIILDLLTALEYIHPDTDRLHELEERKMGIGLSIAEYDEYSKLGKQGILHRDIKPANLVLSEQGVKLIDFNIAATYSSDRMTVVGTFAYMLPDIGTVPWSTDGDLFATGLVLYELITGNHPYPNRFPRQEALPADPRTYMPDLNVNLVRILGRATSCDPKIRYHSASVFKRDLMDLDGCYLEEPS